MKNSSKLRYILLGALLAVLISQLATPAIAAMAQKTIDVFTGINIYVDDSRLIPEDVNGNPVEVFVYNGTTYLPARAISKAFDRPVQWDGETQTVYIGKHSSEKPAVLIQDIKYFSGDGFGHGTLGKDNFGNTYDTYCISPTLANKKFETTYKINGQYTKIKGTLYQREGYNNSVWSNTLQIYGDGKLLFSDYVEGGVEPKPFDVNLTGVLELKIVYAPFTGMGLDFGCRSAIGNFGLYT